MRFRQVYDLACDAGCEASDEAYPRIVQTFVTKPGTVVAVDNWMNAKVLHDRLHIPVRGEIVEGTVAVEMDKACFVPGSTVSVVTGKGKKVGATTIATAAVGFLSPVPATINVAGEKAASLCGMLLRANGKYRKGDGIVVEKGTEITIFANAKLQTGTTSEEVHIAAENFDLPQPSSVVTFVDQWLNARVLHDAVPIPIASEVVEGTVLVEADKASFPASTKVSAITVYGKQVTGTTFSTAVLPFQTSIQAVIEVPEAKEKTMVSGTLLLAKGTYRKDAGVVVSKGTKAAVLIGKKVFTGSIREEIQVGSKMLGISRPGLRRLTQ